MAVFGVINNMTMSATGTKTLSPIATGLAGSVTVRLWLLGSAADTCQFMLDNFVLNGFVQLIPTSANIGQGASGTELYKYGFNGQERDREIGDDSYGALYWEYDSRIGNGVDSRNTLSTLPREGINGQVTIDTKTSWEEDNGVRSGRKHRSTMVFHEMAKNYHRTEFGISYHPSISIVIFKGTMMGVVNPLMAIGAHALAIRDENEWSGSSITPVGYSSVIKQKISKSEQETFRAYNQIYITTGAKAGQTDPL